MNSSVGIMSLILLVLLFLKIPVFVAVLGASVVYFIMTPGINPAVFAQQAITGSESVTLLAIPFFVCAGVLMNYTGVTKRIMDFCSVLTGRMYGGLSQVNILLSTLMGGLSGSALADAAMEAKMLVPEMEAKGIGRAFSTVVTAASSIVYRRFRTGNSPLRDHDVHGIKDLQEARISSASQGENDRIHVLDIL